MAEISEPSGHSLGVGVCLHACMLLGTPTYDIGFHKNENTKRSFHSVSQSMEVRGGGSRG